ANVSFSLSGADSKSYSKFITALRKALPSKEKVSNIPLLLPSASGASRYILMQLSNYDAKAITMAIDVTNVYIMGYLVNSTSYFANESDAKLASQYVFKGSTLVTIPYSGNYERLQNAAGKIREKIPLGFRALDSALTSIFHYDSTAAAAAFLVILQTTAEASRFKYIEGQIIERIPKNEVPSPAALSLENEAWSLLSKQIQLAQTNNGAFRTPVVIIDNKGQRVEITNLASKVQIKDVNSKLLLNKQNIA
uniref:Ribosome-inactivating protein luffin-B n=1 Tax=Luffa aegyptiaca TaxID=3670 RepID=RIPB_LUFAE|nr:RecName: Full=Ribosome-inactivating protein luffin-B; AltName: Full=rRNA N-glycosidase [Luffa aegyptiaca]